MNRYTQNNVKYIGRIDCYYTDTKKTDVVEEYLEKKITDTFSCDNVETLDGERTFRLLDGTELTPKDNDPNIFYTPEGKELARIDPI